MEKIRITDYIYSFFYELYLSIRGAKIGKGNIFCYGTKINFKDSLKIGNHCFFSRNVIINAPTINIGSNLIIYSDTSIICKKKFEIGDRGKISNSCSFRANKIKIGIELWCNEGVIIGEGGWEGENAIVEIGDFQHIGTRAVINPCEKITLKGWGGIGFESMIYSHSIGQGQSTLDGFHVGRGAVTIEKNVSIYTRAMILPGVHIDENSTIAAYSVVRKDIKRNEIVGGIPSKVIGTIQTPLEEELPTKIKDLMNYILGEKKGLESNIFILNSKKILYKERITEEDIKLFRYYNIIICINSANNILLPKESTLFNMKEKFIQGHTSVESEFIRDKLRQNGLRMGYKKYTPSRIDWEKLVKRGIEKI